MLKGTYTLVSKAYRGLRVLQQHRPSIGMQQEKLYNRLFLLAVGTSHHLKITYHFGIQIIH